MSVILLPLEENGRATVVVPDGFLFDQDNAKVNIKKKLIGEFNLHSHKTAQLCVQSLILPSPPICCSLTTQSRQQKHGSTKWIFRLTKHFSDQAHGAEALRGLYHGGTIRDNS